MLNKLQKLRDQKASDQKGFTIIEVMIVLAIAGLIILIVLLAVPALQRNGRNTALKNDVGSVTGGISTAVSNNDGAVVTSVVGAVGSGKATVTAGGKTEDVKIQAGTTVASTAAAATPLAPASVASGTISVIIGQTCSLNSSARAVAVYYSIETSGASSANVKCSDA